MNKKKWIVMILLFLGIVFIGIGIFLENNPAVKESTNHSTNKLPSPSSDSNEMSSGKSERQIELEANLEEIIISYLKNIYGNTYPTEDTLADNPNGISMGVTLREFHEKYGQDISMFHTDEISCNDDYTTGIFRYDTEGPSFEASLICEYTGIL